MKKIKQLIFIAMLLCMTAITNGQSVNATNASTSFGATGLTSRTSGCDIYRYGSDLFRVFVNEADPKLYWRNVIGGTPTTGSISLAYSSILDPDVTLVEDGNKVYAIVVYNNVGSGTKGFYYQSFVWNSGNFINGTTGLLSGGTFGSGLAINIDGDDYGNYVICYDIGGNIYVATGTVFSTVTTPLRVASNSHNKWPDIALYNDGTTNLATLSYVASNSINVEQHTFSNLAAGTNSPTLTTTVSGTTGFTISFPPRVAVPFAAGYSTDWTVVAAEDNTTTFNIIGWNTYGGTLGSTINYTTAGANTTLNNNPNGLPCVAYDNTYPSGSFPIWVGWSFSNISPFITGLDKADFVAALPCDPSGIPVINTPLYEIEKNQVLGDVSDALSLAGCSNGNSDLLLYWINYTVGGFVTGQFAFLDLTAPSCSTSFRISRNELNSLSPLATNVTVSVYSTLGALISQKNVKYSEIDKYILWLKNNLNETFMICLLNDNLGNTQTIKTTIIH